MRDLPVRIAHRLGALEGWRRLAAAAALGAAGALAFAPLHLFPLFFLAIIGLYWQVQGQTSRKRAFAIAWVWGLGHFAAGNFWIANSFLIEPWRFGWMIPPIIGGLAGYLALYPALIAAILYRPGDYRPLRLVAFAGLWTLAEFLRGHLLTGYPWNPAAGIWDGVLPMLQSAALWGAWGLGFFTVMIGAAPAALAGADRRGAWRYLGLVGAIFLALWIGGIWRLDAHPGVNEAGVRLRLVQPNLSQAEKAAGDSLARLMTMSAQEPGFTAITHVIWPESAANFLLEREGEARKVMARIVPAGGALITGTLRAEPLSGKIERLWNSLAVLDHAGEIRATADKFHLVPLGEYVPLRGIFPFINKLTPGDIDFSAAPGPRTIAIPGAPPAGALICYEVIFPGAVRDPGARPAWLVNLTNDGWFGNSPGPYQHFAAARLRAVEEGLPVVRAANTGISGVIDPLGRIVAQSDLGQPAVIDADLPQALPETLFARYAPIFPFVFALIGIVALALASRSRGS